MRFHSFHGACMALAILFSPAASAQATTGTLRLQVPVLQSKEKKGVQVYSALKATKTFDVTVRIYDGPPSGSSQIFNETLTITPKEIFEPNLAAGDIGTADKVAGSVEVILGANPSNPLPDDLLAEDAWFTTQVTTFKKNGETANEYAASPGQPLGVSGIVQGQVLDVAGLTLSDGAADGYVLTADADGNATWQVQAIDTANLQDDSITGAKVQDSSLTGDDIANGTLSTLDIMDNSLTSNDIAEGSITGNDISLNSITGSHIINGVITSSKIGSNAVNSSHIASNTITAFDIATSAVGADEIASGAVGTSEIATDAVNSDKIATNAVGPLEIATNAVGSSEIATDAVGPSEIAANAVDSDEIEDNSITSADIQNSTITGDDVSNSSLTGSDILNGSITTSDIADGTLTGADWNQSSNLVANALYSRGTVRVNQDGPEGDGTLYFYDNGSDTGERIRWDNSENHFETSDNWFFFGDGTIMGNNDVRGDVTIGRTLYQSAAVFQHGGADISQTFFGDEGVEAGTVLVLGSAPQGPSALPSTRALDPRIVGVATGTSAFLMQPVDREQMVDWRRLQEVKSRIELHEDPDGEGSLYAESSLPFVDLRDELETRLAEGQHGELPVAIAGRTVVKVDGRFGAIAVGDPVTSSETPGHAMVLREAGPMLGIALEAFSGGTGEIMVLLNPGAWHGGTAAAEALADSRAEVRPVPVFGEGYLPAGHSSVVVEHPGMTPDAHVLVTFHGPAGNHWVSQRLWDRFLVELEEPATEDLTFSYQYQVR